MLSSIRKTSLKISSDVCQLLATVDQLYPWLYYRVQQHRRICFNISIRTYFSRSISRGCCRQILSIAGGGELIRTYSNHTREIRQQTKPFTVIGEEVDVNRTSEQFLNNKANWERALQKYRECVNISCAGSGEKAIEKHVKRQGKMLITDRVQALVDGPGDFLELSLIAGVGMEYGHVPRANILTGIGKVMGQYCLITALDGAFKGGAIYPITLKKQLRAQEIALQNRLPCIYIVDSAGAFLPLQAEIFNLGGKGFYNEAVMSAARIPQIAIVCGSCTAGGAYIPTMADEAVIVDRAGTIFLGGPPLVQAALGEIISAEELGGATLHCRTSGCTDYFAENETDAFKIGRNIVASLNLSCNTDQDKSDFDEPLYSMDDIPGIMPAVNMLHTVNMYQIIARLVDGSRFHEFKALFGRLLITGFAHVAGHLVGIIANQGEIKENEAVKACHFIQLCCERDVPLIFLQNTATDVVETSTSIKSRAQMLAAVSCASVPRLTVIVGGGFGTSHYLMCGRCMNPNFLFAWPNAHVAIMEPDKLAQEVAQEHYSSPDEDGSTGPQSHLWMKHPCTWMANHGTTKTSLSEQYLVRQHTKSTDGASEDLQKLVEKYYTESSAIFGATRMLNDGIILPQETRQVVAQCLAICKAYRHRGQQDYPVFRF